jgi:MoxR-like ATPase
MAKQRQAFNPYSVFAKAFCGITSKVNPLTDAELLSQNAKANGIENFVEDKKTGNWKMMATFCMLNTKLHTYIQGVAGSGKDTIVEQICAEFRIPFKAFAFKDGINANNWVCRTELRSTASGGTESFVSDGELAKAVKGFKGRDGKLYPYVILLSDMDRARPQDLEILRNALQVGNSAYLIDNVRGGAIPVLPGTLFIATGNTGVDGDPNGTMIANPIDASIMNRFARIRADLPTKDQEIKIIMADHKRLDKPQAKMIADVLDVLRNTVKTLGLPLEVSLRDANILAKSALGFLDIGVSKAFNEALKLATLLVVDGAFKDPRNAEQLVGALDPILKIDVNAYSNATADSNICPLDLE